MNFIFPQNYDLKSKFLGIIDYSTAILNVIWFCIILFLSNKLIINTNIKIFIIILLYFPLFLTSIIGINGENIINIFIYILNYLKKRNIYLYSKY